MRLNLATGALLVPTVVASTARVPFGRTDPATASSSQSFLFGTVRQRQRHRRQKFLPPSSKSSTKNKRRTRTRRRRERAAERTLTNSEHLEQHYQQQNRHLQQSRQSCQPHPLNGDAEDVGILACGAGQCCRESIKSPLGGYCYDQEEVEEVNEDTSRWRELDEIIIGDEGEYVIYYSGIYQYTCNVTFKESFYDGYYATPLGDRCDCSSFDLENYTGSIICTGLRECNVYTDMNAAVCFDVTYYVEVRGPNDYSYSYCGSSAELQQTVCVDFDPDPEPTCQISLASESSTETCICVVDDVTDCMAWDCAEAGHAGNFCDGSPIFVIGEELMFTNQLACAVLQDAEATASFDKLECSCLTAQDPQDPQDPPFSLDCNLQCQLCDEDGSTCAELTSRHLIGQVRNNIQLEHTVNFVQGRSDTIVIQQQCNADERFSLSCDTCSAFLNDSPCDSCELVTCLGGVSSSIFHGFNPKFDCSNVQEGATSDPCLAGDTTVDGDLFSGLSINMTSCLGPIILPEPEFAPTIDSNEFISCSDRDPISPNGALIIGDVINVDSEVSSPFCFETSGSFFGGTWFNVLGDGGLVTVSTCSPATDFDTIISVFNGASCQDLQCVDGNDDGETCGSSQVHSQVSWPSQANELYRVLVRGLNNEIGKFGLSITSTSTSTTVGCEFAISLELGGEESASIQAASPLGERGCGIESLSGYFVGGWFQVIGNGNVFTLSTCLTQANTPTDISVYTGGCGNLLCQEMFEQATTLAKCGTDATLFSNGAVVSWPTQENEVYYVMVSGYQGNFGIRLTDAAVTTVNDQCESAVSVLTDGFPLEGFTQNAIADGESLNDFCETGSENSGLWYSLNGTSEDLSINACSPDGADSKVSVSVFQGNCSDLVCITGKLFSLTCGTESVQDQSRRVLQENDTILDDESDNADLRWFAEAGTIYQILVRGDSPTLAFELSVEVAAPTPQPTSEGTTMSPTISTDPPTTLPSEPPIPMTITPTNSPTAEPTATGSEEAPSSAIKKGANWRFTTAFFIVFEFMFMFVL